LVKLSSRDKYIEIVRCLIQGLTYKQISIKFNCSEGAITWVRQQIPLDPRFRRWLKKANIDYSDIWP